MYTVEVLAVAKIDPRIAQFTKLVERGLECWVDAGALLAKMAADNPDTITDICRSHPVFSRSILNTFLRIGRKEVLPLLVCNPSPGALHLATMPYEIQAQLAGAEIFVARLGCNVALERLSAKDAKVAIGPEGVRSEKEQNVLLRKTFIAFTQNGKKAPGSESMSTFAPSIEEEKMNIDEVLADAQAALLRARGLLEGHRSRALLDRYIAAALTPIGNLRFKLNEESEEKVLTGLLD